MIKSEHDIVLRLVFIQKDSIHTYPFTVALPLSLSLSLDADSLSALSVADWQGSNIIFRSVARALNLYPLHTLSIRVRSRDTSHCFQICVASNPSRLAATSGIVKPWNSPSAKMETCHWIQEEGVEKEAKGWCQRVSIQPSLEH